MHSIFSIDVEDWFNISAVDSEPDVSCWDSLPTSVERDLPRLLELFGESGVKVTCFFLGYFARRFPFLVRQALDQGHEIASHGFHHRLAYRQNAEDFYQDVLATRKLLEDISGRLVLGYRAAAFSVTRATPWFFDRLAQAGYAYDSSVFPAPHGIGGIKTDRLAPHELVTAHGRLVEFPVTAVRVLGKPMCFFGGGYLRISPYPLIRAMGRRVLAEGRPVVFYIHPREINPGHPRLPMGLKRRFKSYVNLRTVEGKLRRIVRDFELTTFADWLSRHPRIEAGPA
jgi:polysaccharide deacetylase family protein (PEP-CTERM system associated)